jgi:excinuclease ABC subunit B
MAEELTRYYAELGLKIKYMHSDIDAIERNQLIRELRLGGFDVLVGINLLREGLDLPEVSLIGVLDADKEGFLRSETSLIQTMGRAARNENGKVILFANKITASMQKAIDITTARRKKQEEFNALHNITPKTVIRKLDENLHADNTDELALKKKKMDKIPTSQRREIVKELTKKMHEAAKALEFEKAAQLRDEIMKLREL